jgi:hypothetical protein
MSYFPRRLSCKLCQEQLQLSERKTLSDLLHYLAPLAVLGALIVYSRFAKRKNVPKYIYWMTMVAGGFLIMSLLRI